MQLDSSAGAAAVSGRSGLASYDGDGSLAQLLEELVRALWMISRLELPPSVAPMERASQMVLGHAEELGAARTTDLASHMGLDVSTVSRQAHKLVAAGLMQQREDPADGRACLLEVTSKGREALAAIRAARGEQLSRLLSEWSPEDRKTCIRLLGRLAEDLQAKREPHGSGAGRR
jgi:DNA-binding MarR family transcriptional regulator